MARSLTRAWYFLSSEEPLKHAGGTYTRICDHVGLYGQLNNVEEYLERQLLHR
jgi:hypothetical protein